MGASITLAGESLIAQKLGTQQRLDVVRFIFANVPGLDPNAPVNRAAAKPPAAQIVHTYAIPEQNTGYVNPNQVVYSSMLGSDVGDFDWNWIGLETAENVLLAVAYVPLQQKRKNIPPLQLGNNVTRNIMVVFDGAQALTGITIDAKTWQHDFTIRLKGIDERERLSNRDVFGRACFFGDAFQVEKVGTAYQLKPGLAYVEGIRIELANTLPVTLPGLPIGVFVHVALRRALNDTVAAWSIANEGVDYTDSAGTRHYFVALAYLKTSDNTDFRTVEPISGPLIQHLAARNGDYEHLRARATTKDDVELGNLPNAISDDAGTDSSKILATTKAVFGVRKFLQQAIDKLIDGTTPAGKAKQLETARKVSISGIGTGSATFDGTADVNIQVTMPDIVASWKYTKVTVNAKGLVTYGENLQPVDIPALDWSKITSGKPTTLAGYGITDTLYTGGPSRQRPILYAPIPGGFFAGGGALEIREALQIGFEASTLDYGPRISFHWSGITASDLVMGHDGALRWNDKIIFHEGNLNPNTIVPPGAIMTFAMAAIPAGYLRANGAAVSRTTYAALFEKISTYYGAGDGATTFNLPDLRGTFIRGMDEGRGLDPGRVFGTFQWSQNASHSHTASSDVQGAHSHGMYPILVNIATNQGGGHYSVGPSPTAAGPVAGAHNHTITVDASGGTESRPSNVAMNYCIKY